MMAYRICVSVVTPEEHDFEHPYAKSENERCLDSLSCYLAARLGRSARSALRTFRKRSWLVRRASLCIPLSSDSSTEAIEAILSCFLRNDLTSAPHYAAALVEELRQKFYAGGSVGAVGDPGSEIRDR